MSTPQENAAPASPVVACPWYKTAVIRGILLAFFTQVIARVAARYHIDIATLQAFGINPDVLVQLTIDAISSASLAYAFHGRVVKPLPAVTLTGKEADALNAAAAQENGGSNSAAPLSQPPEKTK